MKIKDLVQYFNDNNLNLEFDNKNKILDKEIHDLDVRVVDSLYAHKKISLSKYIVVNLLIEDGSVKHHLCEIIKSGKGLNNFYAVSMYKHLKAKYGYES